VSGPSHDDEYIRIALRSSSHFHPPAEQEMQLRLRSRGQYRTRDTDLPSTVRCTPQSPHCLAPSNTTSRHVVARPSALIRPGASRSSSTSPADLSPPYFQWLRKTPPQPADCFATQCSTRGLLHVAAHASDIRYPAGHTARCSKESSL